MRFVLASVILSFATCSGGGGSAPPEAGAIAVAPASFGDNAHVSADVQKKCEVDETISKRVAEAVGGSVGTGSDKEVHLTIVRVSGAELGWQGDIKVILEGELMEHGMSTRTFRFTQGHPPGVLGGMGGICSGIDHAARLLGEDIDAWLSEPPPSR